MSLSYYNKHVKGNPELKAKKRLYDIEYRKRNGERLKQIGVKYRTENAALLKIRRAAEFQKHKQRYRDNWNKHVLRYRYGITVAQYDKMLKDQNGVCKICNRFRLSAQQRRMGVDHCHTTGKIRGILCDWCNSAISRFDDDVTLVEAAAQYLKTNGADVDIGPTTTPMFRRNAARKWEKWK